MTKEEAKAYCEILDNLKRDLAAECDKKDVSLIREKVESYASGAYTKDGDELIVIPSSALDEIFGDTKKTDCRKCKHFILCSLEKQIFYNDTRNICKEYVEAKQ